MKYFLHFAIVACLVCPACESNEASEPPAESATDAVSSATSPAEPESKPKEAEKPAPSETQPATPETKPAPLVAPGESKKDIPYAAIEGVKANLLSLDVYRPAAKTKTPAPIMLFIHGGGWCIGDKSRTHNKVEHFTKAGFVYVTINYRLSPAVAHPVHVQDVARAVAWVHSNAARIGGDPKRLTLMGHSAGAHLAALVAIDERYLKAEKLTLDIVSAVILLDGAGYDLPKRMSGAIAGRPKSIFTQAFGSDPAAQKDASPITHIAAKKGIAPFLMFHVERRDDSREQCEALAKKFKAAGVESEVVSAKGKTHRTLNVDLGKPDDAPTQRIMKFLEE